MKIALLADIHANIFALEAVFSDLERENIDKIIVAGDLIGYYYWPRDVIKILMENPRVICVRGNHENILGEILFDNAARIRYSKKYGSGHAMCLRQLTSLQIDWLLNLPEFLVLDIDGVSFYIGHGSLQSVNDYIYPDSSLHVINKNYSGNKVSVYGHAHYPYIHANNGCYLVNPGSIGQPRDVGGLASYVIVNTENLVFRFMRRAFNIDPILDAVKKYDPELEYLAKIMVR